MAGTSSIPGVRTSEGYDWMVRALWTGNRGKGFIRSVNRIYDVKGQNGKAVSGIYAYVPPEAAGEFLAQDEAGNVYVPEKKAVKFHVPEREGGTEDKFLKLDKKDWFDF